MESGCWTAADGAESSGLTAWGRRETDPRKMEARQRKMKEESGASPSAAESAAEPGWM